MNVLHSARSENTDVCISLTENVFQVTDEYLTPSDDPQGNLPSGTYKEVMCAGAEENKLPKEYVKKLREMPDDGTKGTMELGMSLHLQD